MFVMVIYIVYIDGSTAVTHANNNFKPSKLTIILQFLRLNICNFEWLQLFNKSFHSNHYHLNTKIVKYIWYYVFVY